MLIAHPSPGFLINFAKKWKFWCHDAFVLIEFVFVFCRNKMSIYQKKSLLDNRYQLLATSSIYTYDDENLTSYADFLK